MRNPLKDFLDTLRKNTDMLRAYANKKCNSCLGKGYMEITQPGQSPEAYMCECIECVTPICVAGVQTNV